MLKPDARTHLLELLRPPPGCRLDTAVGTTFSLDLTSALMLPLSFAFFDWEHADGKPAADPLALLEALRRYGDRFSVFCQSGQIRLPQGKCSPLVTFLEKSIFDVQPPDEEGVFHPKVWALRFVSEEGEIRYRVLCLSRNLTFDRCWDTVVSLDGELRDRTNAIKANHPLGDFIAALPKLATRRVPDSRREDIRKMADELRRVRFDWPEGFDADQCAFWVAGLDGRASTVFEGRSDKALIVAPFVSESVVHDFVENSGETHLVSRPEALQEISVDVLRQCKSVKFLNTSPTEETNDVSVPLDRSEVLEGLHAKIYVIDHGWDASVLTGSFNATVHALRHNVEFMVELVGKRSRCGVDAFLKATKGETRFADLLQDFSLDLPTQPADDSLKALDRIIQLTKRAIAAAKPQLAVVPGDAPGLFDVRFEWQRTPLWPAEIYEVYAWPITQPQERALRAEANFTLSRVSYEGLTPLLAFSVKAKSEATEGGSVFVLNLPLLNAPEDREERVLASLVGSHDKLLRYILFLLASSDEAAAASGELARLLAHEGTSERSVWSPPPLLETMLRTLHRHPEQLERVAALLEALRKAPDGSQLLSEEFQRIWEPIWATAQAAGRK